MALINYTSGTTGGPKGAVITHANIVANAAGVAMLLMNADGEDIFRQGDRYICYLPLAHIYERFNFTLVTHFGASSGFYRHAGGCRGGGGGGGDASAVFGILFTRTLPRISLHCAALQGQRAGAAGGHPGAAADHLFLGAAPLEPHLRQSHGAGAWFGGVWWCCGVGAGRGEVRGAGCGVRGTA